MVTQQISDEAATLNQGSGAGPTSMTASVLGQKLNPEEKTSRGQTSCPEVLGTLFPLPSVRSPPHTYWTSLKTTVT